VAIFLPEQEGADELTVAATSERLDLPADELAVADWVFRRGQPAGRNTDTLPAANLRYLPMKTARGVVGVLGVAGSPEPQRHLTPAQRRLMDAFANQVALSVERDNLAQQARQAVVLQVTEKLQAALLNSISHELRTPLNAIIGFSQIVRDEMFGPVGSPRYKDYMIDIEGSGQHLLGIINDILDIAKIEANRMTLTREWIDPASFIAEAAAVTRGQPRAMGVAIEVEQGPTGAVVYADARMMRQTLINLLSNAVKHSLPGTPVLIRTHVTAGGRLRLEVVDQGAGIPQDMLEKVFDAFEQADNSFAREKQGTGLGLALVRAFVRAHGGRVWLESAPGEGTTAIIELPGARPVAAIAA